MRLASSDAASSTAALRLVSLASRAASRTASRTASAAASSADGPLPASDSLPFASRFFFRFDFLPSSSLAAAAAAASPPPFSAAPLAAGRLSASLLAASRRFASSAVSNAASDSCELALRRFRPRRRASPWSIFTSHTY
jgi:hypothetical protein